MLATTLSQLNRIDFKGPSVASEGNYITNKLNLLKCLLELQERNCPETPTWNTIIN